MSTFQPVEITSPFKVLVSDVVNLHPYTEAIAREAGILLDGEGAEVGRRRKLDPTA